MPQRTGLRRRRLRAVSGALVLLGMMGLFLDLRAPAVVAWETGSLQGLQADRAPGLVIQDRVGDVTWATRGFGLYRSEGAGDFAHVLTLLPSPSEAWAGFSATFRDWSRHQELVELVLLSEREGVAFAGGEVFRLDLEAGSAERVHTLRYYGRGEGRGVMPHGITRDGAGHLYYGEYPTRRLGASETVRVYRSTDRGRHWDVAHEFTPGAVRHVHAVQWDPHGEALWVATGDSDAESRIGYSRDGGTSFTWVGAGSQRFRAVSLLFREHEVSWATDSDRVGTANRVVSFDRSSGQIRDVTPELPGPGYYARALGDDHGVVTLAERVASVVLVDGSTSRTLFHWDVEPDANRPHPSVRLLRSFTAPSPEALLLNPLRVAETGAAIYRVDVSRIDRARTVASVDP